jgi:hypothetical protein
MGWLYGLVSVIAIYAAHRISCWAEDRGYIYYRKKSGRSGMAASAFLEIHSMMEPSKKHVLEVMRDEDDEQDDAAGPPKP